jgi:16S rRNA (adenine1518-N6/adenine1519-N6)-dimethyltransferase
VGSLKPKKRLGQHFLTAPYYAQRIADAVPMSDSGTVMEIGPGQGALSVYLKNRFPRFHLIEKDLEVLPRLKEKLGQGDWTIHAEDILSVDMEKFTPPLCVVGNLPYNIGAFIIKKVLMTAPAVTSVTFMVQREVAERIVSGPDTKENGFLSILCQYFGNPEILFHVPCGAFFPKPRVESSVFQLVLNPERFFLLPKEKWLPFFSFVSRGFSMRRKMVAKTLSWKHADKKEYEDLLKQVDIDIKARAENLTVFHWVNLFKVMGDRA